MYSVFVGPYGCFLRVPISPPLFEEPRRSRSAGLFRFPIVLLSCTTEAVMFRSGTTQFAFGAGGDDFVLWVGLVRLVTQS